MYAPIINFVFLTDVIMKKRNIIGKKKEKNMYHTINFKIIIYIS